MFSCLSRSVSRLVVAACLLGATVPCLAQATRGEIDHPDSRVDIYGGYGYFHPINSGIDGFQYMDVTNPNATASVTGWFNHYIGVQMEGGYFSGNGEHRSYLPTCAKSTCDQLVYTAQAGPVFRLPLGRFIPFVHALGGGARVNGPAAQQLKWGWGVTGGAGFDYVLPFFNNHLAVRPIQADFQYSQVVYGPLVLPQGIHGGFGEIDALKLSGGLVLRFGEKIDKEAVMLGCTTEPVVVHPGDIVSVTSNTLGLNPKRKRVYTWATNGGTLTASDSTASVDTASLAPGDYTVTGHVEQGTRASQQASCTSAFTVKPFEPPTVSCSAVPSTATSGTPVEITTTGISPQNRPLTYSYTATEGQITSNGPTAQLSTAGLDPGVITVTCNAVDDYGQAAKNMTEVTIVKPAAPVLPQTQALCSISFNRDRRRPVRVDNESKACLDDIALALNNQAGAKLVVVGNASPDEQPEAAAERAMNERQYLTEEKGVDPARIELRVGQTSGRTVDNTLVPAGAIFGDTNTESFDESAIKRHGEAYGKPGAHVPHRRRKRPVAVTPAATPTTAAKPWY